MSARLIKFDRASADDRWVSAREQLVPSHISPSSKALVGRHAGHANGPEHNSRRGVTEFNDDYARWLLMEQRDRPLESP
jgi:hypothetical protein